MPKRDRKRRREQTRPRGRADERKALQPHLDRPRTRTLADHDIDLVILERRVQNLFDDRRHPMDLVDEQHVAWRKVGHDADQIARLLNRRPRRGADRRAHLVADHVGQRGLAEARRTVQQHVIERLAALPGRRDRHLEVLADAVLPDVLVQPARAKARLVLRVLVDARRRHQTIVSHQSSVVRVISRALSTPASTSVRRCRRQSVLMAASTALSASGR